MMAYKIEELEKESKHAKKKRHDLQERVSVLSFSMDEYAKNIDSIENNITKIMDNHLSHIEKDIATQKVRHGNNENSINDIKETQKWQTRFLLGSMLGIIANIFLTFV